MSMRLERFMDKEQKIMVLKPNEGVSLHSCFHQAIFFASKYTCDEYRLELPRKTLVFTPKDTKVSLEKKYQLLTKEEYQLLEHNVKPFSRDGWSAQDEQELHAFLFDLALLTHNIPWANELYNEIY